MGDFHRQKSMKFKILSLLIKRNFLVNVNKELGPIRRKINLGPLEVSGRSNKLGFFSILIKRKDQNGHKYPKKYLEGNNFDKYRN